MPAGPFLVLHGLGGSGPGHWQRWIADALRGLGAEVRFPALPEPDAPAVPAWRAALAAELRRDDVVLCHSLACLLWLGHAADPVGPPVERVLLVAPPCADAPELAGWLPAPLDARGVARAAAATRLVCADDDPWCPQGAAKRYGAPLGLPVDLVPDGGHLNPETGFGPWPGVLAWAQGAKNGVET